MAKRKKLKISFSKVKIVLVIILALVIGFLIYKGINNYLSSSDYFKIKNIMIDPSLHFINKRNFQKVKGKNIFNINIKEIRRKLTYKYPQVAQLKISRRFPDQILISATKRSPLAQTEINNKTLTIDNKGVILSTSSKLDDRFPLIFGVKSNNRFPSLGRPLRGKNVRVALKIIELFQKDKVLSLYRISSVYADNLSKIFVNLSNNIKIIIDEDNIERKIKVLSLVFTQSNINNKEVKYIDLRFKEPIIGKK